MFMNSPLGRTSAEGLAARSCRRRAARLGPPRLQARIRPRPDPAETRLALDFLARQTSTYAADKKPEPARRALVDFCQALLSMSEASTSNE